MNGLDTAGNFDGLVQFSTSQAAQAAHNPDRFRNAKTEAQIDKAAKERESRYSD